jgi:hypothetical protein
MEQVLVDYVGSEQVLVNCIWVEQVLINYIGVEKLFFNDMTGQSTDNKFITYTTY